ncbi:ATP-binding cassette domain-containing protein [Bailinhaonella thermotolerans]|uniref:UvrABC system protein A n=1 Tax=Bailinhaonella thermotolerans TaxID=1070861 RepID=A0A3A4B0C8_9ACTN|nr:excinuclease ABC subunit UvrA [Bailinhaonella thermotolerans]RJL30910.1 excinuclease ABC subunit UvrA [Bailinhaonella thermotolerans]
MRDIVVKGARQHNLKNVSLRVPGERITVFTGVSGSGKSSLVFGTIAAEARRQLAETFPSFARHRLERPERPEADLIDDLPAAIVVDQRPVGGNARSTVGTMTEVHPILRVLFSRYGRPSAGLASAYSFNDPQGMCRECDGLGRTVSLDVDRLIDWDKSLNEGAIGFPAFAVGRPSWQLYAESGLFDPDRPLKDFSPGDRELLLHGSGFRVRRASRRGVYQNEYEGVVTVMRRRYLTKDPEKVRDARTREALERVSRAGVCPECGGARLNAAALASKIGGRNIADLAALEISDLIRELEAIDDPVATPIADAALAALRRIEDFGLGYLSLDRETSTLSGGEGQRLKTVRHLGSALTGMLYVFDEPTVGLHPRDVHRLTRMLTALRDKGNTVLLVEHDRDAIAVADHVVDLGPGAGANGGEIVYEGPLAGLYAADTATGRALREPYGLKAAVREPAGWLPIRGANLHNLRDVDVDIPTGVLTAVTGVAGSGKSTLIARVLPERHEGVVLIGQGAIGSSSRSTPASYVGVLDPIRRLFARAGGVDAALFSFNSAGGCPACGGRGVVTTDLAFLDPVTTVCEVCEGRRYRPEALEHRYAGRTIAEVLESTVEEALTYLTEDSVRPGLERLAEVGLPYLTLGQPLSTLSGGERQRLKLADRLRETGLVYVFDEPSTGLHPADVGTLLALLDRIVDAGNTVIVIEHDLDLVKRADWVIDLGPEAGRHGGRVVFTGTPAALARAEGSHTADHLRRDLAARLPAAP